MSSAALYGFYEEYFSDAKLVRPQAALLQLTAHPRAFLNKYALACDEIVGQTSGTLQAYFYTTGGLADAKRPGTVLKTHRMHDTETFHFCLLNPPLGKPDNAYTSVQVHYVEMVSATSATVFNNIVWKPLTTNVQIMVTVQLSGCSFLWRTQNGVLECAHLQPTGGLTGPQLQAQLTGHGANVYGRDDYGEGRVVTIVGVKRGSDWRIYAQKFRVGTSEILSVHRIQPSK